MTPTLLRSAVLAVLALLALAFPDALPEATREAIATHAETALGSVLALWAIFAGMRARKQSRGDEP